MSGQETPRIEFTGKLMPAREVRRWQRRFHLADSVLMEATS